MVLGIVLLHARQSSGVYDYPVKPGTPKWKALKGQIEMQNICQIPESILKEISTSDLIETCLQYPLYFDMFYFDNFQIGFESVASHLNGLQVQRTDSEEYLKRFLKMGPTLTHILL
jgi:hypothetical protein